MRRYTQHATIDEFFDAGGFEFDTEEEVENIPEQQLNVQVQATTHFSSWQEMLNKAGDGWQRNLISNGIVAPTCLFCFT